MTLFLFASERDVQWQPAVDVYRSGTGWILKFELAGVRLDDIQVHIGKRTVFVSGVRRDSVLEESGCCHYSMEISYSRFERTIELPEDLDEARLQLDYRDGILFVRISVNNEKEQK